MHDGAGASAAEADDLAGARRRSTIFRWRDRKSLMESGAMTFHDSPEMKEQLQLLGAVNNRAGSTITHLFEGSGLSLAHAWYKSGYPVMLHAHDVDCLYYVTDGSLHFGTEELGPGDGFLVPGGVIYSFTAGDQGAELVEFRPAEHFSTRFTSTKKSYWDRLAATIRSCHDRWRNEAPPSGRL